MSERSNSAIYAPEVRRIAVNSHLDQGCGDALLVGVDKDTENAAGNRCGRKAHFRPKTDSAVRNGGVRSQIRTGLHLQFPANREFAGNIADSGSRAPIPTLYLTSKISGF
jgi:hypothetical protein